MDSINDSPFQWFVMRDLKRSNAKNPAYKELGELGYKVFTPLTSKIIEKGGKRNRIQIPIVQDLLFVYSKKEDLDAVVARIDTLQFRFVKGAPFGTAMTVPEKDMDRFITAVSGIKTPKYYTPDEITPNMYGAAIRMIGDGPMTGIEGRLLKIKGSGKKRLLIELPGLLSASIEIGTSDYIELVDE